VDCARAGAAERVRLHIVHPNEVKWISQSSARRTRSTRASWRSWPGGSAAAEGTCGGRARARAAELVGRGTRCRAKRVALMNTLRATSSRRAAAAGEVLWRTDWQAALAKLEVGRARSRSWPVQGGIEALAHAEGELTRRIVAIKDRRIELLESIPSIGELSARVLLGALDEAKRFDNKKCVAKYGALSPRIYQSGDVVHLGRINRDGRQELRRVLLQCAHTLTRMRSPGARPLPRSSNGC